MEEVTLFSHKYKFLVEVGLHFFNSYFIVVIGPEDCVEALLDLVIALL